jgi:hypothetical protein
MRSDKRAFSSQVVSLGDSENAIKQMSIFKPSDTLGGSENAIRQIHIFKPSGTLGGSENAINWMFRACPVKEGEPDMHQAGAWRGALPSRRASQSGEAQGHLAQGIEFHQHIAGAIEPDGRRDRPQEHHLPSLQTAEFAGAIRPR